MGNVLVDGRELSKHHLHTELQKRYSAVSTHLYEAILLFLTTELQIVKPIFQKFPKQCE